MRRKRPLRAAFSSTAPSGRYGNMCSVLPANAAIRVVWRAGCPSPVRPCPEVVDLSRMYQLAEASPTAPVPPQNLDAEESVLGAMMLSPGAIGAVSEVLSASDFYRASHGVDLQGGARPVREGRAGRRDHALRRARAARRARGDRRPRAHQRARGARPRDLERRPLRQDRPRDGDAPRPGPGRAGDRAPRPRARGARRRGARRQGGVGRLRPLAGAGRRRVHPHRGPAQGQLRADHRAVRGRRRRHRRRRAATRSSTGSPPASSPAT